MCGCGQPRIVSHFVGVADMHASDYLFFCVRNSQVTRRNNFRRGAHLRKGTIDRKVGLLRRGRQRKGAATSAAVEWSCLIFISPILLVVVEIVEVL